MHARRLLLDLLLCLGIATLTPTVSAAIPLDDFAGRPGSHLDGIADGDVAGDPVSGVGDINGDGVDDLAVHSEFASVDGIHHGVTYLVFGRPGRLPDPLPLSSLDGRDGTRIVADRGHGNEAGVDAAGDFNGDGIADLVVGVPADERAQPVDAGLVCVVFGRRDFPAEFRLGTIDGHNGTCFVAEPGAIHLGQRVVGLGDFDGDGIDDLAVASLASGHPPAGSGSVYVLLGRRGERPALQPLAALDGRDGFRIDGLDGADAFGIALAAGDFDGDGRPDLAIGADGAVGPAGRAGALVLLFGRAGPFAASLAVDALDGLTGTRIDGTIANAGFGRAAALVDLDGDGRSELAIGTLGGPDYGAVDLVAGRPRPLPPRWSIDAARTGHRIAGLGRSAMPYFGRALARAGDVDGDGIDDLAIGAPGHGVRAPAAGSVYLLFGRRGALPDVSGATELHPPQGLRLDGVDAGALCGQRFGRAGDLDGDGIADLAIGCSLAAAGGTARGRIAALYGKSGPRGDGVVRLPDQPVDASHVPVYRWAELAATHVIDRVPSAGAALIAAPPGELGHWKFRYRPDDDFEPLPEELSLANAAVIGPDAELKFVPEHGLAGSAPELLLLPWDGAGEVLRDQHDDIRDELGALGGFAPPSSALRLRVDLMAVPPVLFDDDFESGARERR
jgi:glycosylphosphatidylinositol phospholipase D